MLCREFGPRESSAVPLIAWEPTLSRAVSLRCLFVCLFVGSGRLGSAGELHRESTP
jgi:hypothetical protein